MNANASEPVLLALLFADRVITEDNGKRGIIGTFTKFFAQQFPVVFPPWGIYICVTNLTPGDHEFTLELEFADTSEKIMGVGGTIRVNNGAEPVEIGIPIPHAVFPREGRYILLLRIGGDIVGSRPLWVDQVPAQPPSV
ncbi:hypothetical protein LEP1GSC058_2369 [Leptospira fainei serovar Hurstbridge str. BUT 6]|uniref:Uncharacterized protein n=1 Tax=Leptospira fainei serovar Hurstbridge str. BUT 6 TaxID=1193011 RepID=S3V162_9LEPT|nr:hypothetical protein [Leptospira fainei]EPG74359.1 hypothetical protein LEP1GSC058_2369 [Leptospira fainei serovar Hurstbridge str. BUT 6]